ncbi:MAG: hypothetical protein ACRC6V_02200 [Bacteroidales bacterium]
MFELGNIGSYMKSGYNAMEQGVLSMAHGVKKSKFGALAGMDQPGDLGKLYGDVDFDDPANDELLGVISDVEEETAKAGKKEDGMDFDKISKVLASIKPVEGPNVPQASARPSGFNYNSKLYENPLLTREYQSLYSQPLYNKLT